MSFLPITLRRLLYDFSWKGDPIKSGDIAMNIGVDFFVLLFWYFGKVVERKVLLAKPNTMTSFIELGNAKVHWYLSIDCNDLTIEVLE
ncbi:hypothetical protein ACFLS9_05105 [Bacteroidota bacterium]